MKSELTEDFARKVYKSIDSLLHRLEVGLREEEDDYRVYTGSAGISLLNLHLYSTVSRGQDEQYLHTALSHIKRPLRHLKGQRVTFMCGDAGPLALGAVIYSKLGQKKESKDCIQRLEQLHQKVCGDMSLPDELLFGRVGYLYALLYVQRNVGEDQIDHSITTTVYRTILKSGESLARKKNWAHPLMYAWHDKYYLGAAHGLAGIFHVLLQISDPTVSSDMERLVKPSVDYMLTLQFPSGNCPSSLESSSGDKLIHWCHGAPGWIHMFISAYKTFGDEKYLAAARHCGDVIWDRGLLRKGYGLCHGTGGNAYAFLTLFKLTKEQKYLYRACKFAEWCFDYGSHGCRIPDTPYSLFEGQLKQQSDLSVCDLFDAST